MGPGTINKRPFKAVRKSKQGSQCCCFARRTVCGRLHFKKDASEAQKSARAELPRTGEEELGRVVLASTESR